MRKGRTLSLGGLAERRRRSVAAPRDGESRREALTRLRGSLQRRGGLSAFAGTPCAGRAQTATAGAPPPATGTAVRKGAEWAMADDSTGAPEGGRARGGLQAARRSSPTSTASRSWASPTSGSATGPPRGAPPTSSARSTTRVSRSPKRTIFDSQSGELIETSPFVVLNLDKVDFLYARDDEAPAGARPTADAPA